MFIGSRRGACRILSKEILAGHRPRPLHRPNAYPSREVSAYQGMSDGGRRPDRRQTVPQSSWLMVAPDIPSARPQGWCLSGAPQPDASSTRRSSARGRALSINHRRARGVSRLPDAHRWPTTCHRFGVPPPAILRERCRKAPAIAALHHAVRPNSHTNISAGQPEALPPLLLVLFPFGRDAIGAIKSGKNP
jgi:hypothetical protein